MRHSCYECEVLKEFYWLKVNQYLMASQSPASRTQMRRPVSEEELQALKDEAMGALTALIGHWKACYGLGQDVAA